MCFENSSISIVLPTISKSSTCIPIIIDPLVNRHMSSSDCLNPDFVRNSFTVLKNDADAFFNPYKHRLAKTTGPCSLPLYISLFIIILPSSETQQHGGSLMYMSSDPSTFNLATKNAVLMSLVMTSRSPIPAAISIARMVVSFTTGDEIPGAYFGVGWTKVYVEKMCEFYSSLGRTKHTAIRHSNTYGPYDKYDLEKSHMFGATITKVMNAKDGDEVVVWGDGSTERDLLYVDDVVDFIDLAIKNQKTQYELINVGYGSSFSVSEIVSKIVNFSGKNLKISHDMTKPSINTKLSLCSNKAKRIFGWSPKINLDEGIKRTIAWYNSNICE